MKSSRGFTLIELAVTMAIIGVLAAVLLPSAREMMIDGKTTASISQAKAILSVCEIARTKAIGTVISKDRYIVAVQHNTPINWTNAEQLKVFVTDDFKVPSLNAHGNQILFKFDAERCYVAVDVPGSTPGIEGYITTPQGTNTRIIVSSRPLPPSKPHWVNHQQRVLYNDAPR